MNLGLVIPDKEVRTVKRKAGKALGAVGVIKD